MLPATGSVANVLLTRIKEINADTVDYESALEQEWRKKVTVIIKMMMMIVNITDENW